jgi:hypothetical protein
MGKTRTSKTTRIIGLIVTAAIAVMIAPATAASAATASLVNVIDTSSWSPNSPDPSGIAWVGSESSLVVVDGEVEEMPPYWAGVNVWHAGVGGNIKRTWNTIAFSSEPVGAAWNQANNHLFISDDNKDLITEVSPGGDGSLGTADDGRTSFGTKQYGSSDPEGLTFGGGALFISDGSGAEIYRIDPKSNGFNGVPPAGDDVVTHFDTSAIGATDPEAAEYDAATNHLLIISRPSKLIFETTLSGSVVGTFDMSSSGISKPAGIALAPGSNNASQMHAYVTDRAVDNNNDPNENDGRIYEFNLGSPTGGGGPTVLETSVQTGTDDAEETSSGNMRLGSSDLELTEDKGVIQTVGIRFSSVSVPKNATITNVYIQFQTDEVTTAQTNLLIQGQLADNAGTFTSTQFDISSRPRTGARVSWAPAAWSVKNERGPSQRTPDLSGVVSEIIAQSGWSQGKSMVFIITGTGKRTAESFNGSFAPVLHIEYTT